MATRSDFAIVSFSAGGEQLGVRREVDRFQGTVFVGDESSVQEFQVDGSPTGRAYVIMQTAEIQAFDHKILINGTDINEGTDLLAGSSKTFQTPMAIIGDGLLKIGSNTIQIVRGTSTGDSFSIYNAAVHWRERDVPPVRRQPLG